MRNRRFEWDDAKAALNAAKHDVTFEQACEVFGDMTAVDAYDNRRNYGEERATVIGVANGLILHVTYTERGEGHGLFQRGRHRDMSGKETSLAVAAKARPMTEEEILRAAYDDPDAIPMTDEEWAKARKVSRAKIIRRAMGLTQEEFAARYQIPLGTLRDWEQGAAQPDATAKAYLKAIAGNPSAVFEALTGSRLAAE